jgi:hypothetical protein
VGEWTYPILKAHYGGYMFPDLEGDITGGAVGIIIPDTVGMVKGAVKTSEYLFYGSEYSP